MLPLSSFAFGLYISISFVTQINFFYKFYDFGWIPPHWLIILFVFRFQLYCGFSGQVMIDQMYLMLFNLLFTSLPPFAIGGDGDGGDDDEDGDDDNGEGNYTIIFRSIWSRRSSGLVGDETNALQCGSPFHCLQVKTSSIHHAVIINIMFYFIHPKSEHILVCHAMSSSQSLPPSPLASSFGLNW